MNDIITIVEVFANSWSWLGIVISLYINGIIVDKYQEERITQIGNAMSNGVTIMLTLIAWIPIIFLNSSNDLLVLGKLLFALFIFFYGFTIFLGGFFNQEYSIKYGKIRFITFILILFTLMFNFDNLFNFFFLLISIFIIFPIYYYLTTIELSVFPEPKKLNDNSDDNIHL